MNYRQFPVLAKRQNWNVLKKFQKKIVSDATKLNRCASIHAY